MQHPCSARRREAASMSGPTCYTPRMDNPPPGQAFTKRLWPKGVAIPERWTLFEELSQVGALSHPDFVIIYGWFDPTWREGQGESE